MAIVAPLEERNQPRSKCLDFFPITLETNCARPSLLDLSYIVVEKTSVVMQEKILNNDLQLSGKIQGDIPLLGNQEDASLKCRQQATNLVGSKFHDSSMKLSSSDHVVSQLRDEDIGIDIDLGEENFGKSKLDDDSLSTSKGDCPVTGILQRQTSLKTCGKLMDIVTNHSAPILNLISREKFCNDRAHDFNSRWKKCKRAAIFDSRRIVLVFSILSSLGTLVLIYLTLRIRQAAENFVNA